jgi:hypothetical protein
MRRDLSNQLATFFDGFPLPDGHDVFWTLVDANNLGPML